MTTKSDIHRWADPSPAGLVATALSCFVFFAMHSGRVEANAAPLLGIWLLGGFIVQVIVGLIELKHGNLIGGNVFLFYSAIQAGCNFFAVILVRIRGPGTFITVLPIDWLRMVVDAT